MTTTDTPQVQDTTKVSSLAQWKKARVHEITLPSASVVAITIPDLPGLVKAGAIPNELIDIAISVAEGSKKITRDDLIKQADFYNKLIPLTVVKPQIKDEDVDDIPQVDKEMIVEFATRQRDIDAIGHQIGGLEKVKDWRTFRGVGPLYPDLED